MKKALVAAMVTLATFLVSAGTLTPAHAYPEPAVRVTISDEIVVGGQKLVVNASASVSCAWTATFAGQKRRGAGEDFTATFKAPKVKKKTVYPVTVSCSYADASAARTTADNPGTSTVSRTFRVTVLPPDSKGSGRGARRAPRTAPAPGGSCRAPADPAAGC